MPENAAAIGLQAWSDVCHIEFSCSGSQWLRLRLHNPLSFCFLNQCYTIVGIIILIITYCTKQANRVMLIKIKCSNSMSCAVLYIYIYIGNIERGALWKHLSWIPWSVCRLNLSNLMLICLAWRKLWSVGWNNQWSDLFRMTSNNTNSIRTDIRRIRTSLASWSFHVYEYIIGSVSCLPRVDTNVYAHKSSKILRM